MTKQESPGFSRGEQVNRMCAVCGEQPATTSHTTGHATYHLCDLCTYHQKRDM